MANIRFKLLSDEEKEKEKIRFQIIDSNPIIPSSDNNIAEDNKSSKKAFNSNSIIAKNKEKKVNLPIVNDLNNKEEIDPTLPILPTKTIGSDSIKDKSLELANVMPNNVSKKTINLPDVIDEKLKRTANGGNIGDLTTAIGKTALTGANYLGQGVIKGIEGTMDMALDVVTSNANPYYWFNQDQLKSHQNIAQELIKKDATKDLITNLSGDENFNGNFLDKDSLIKSDNLGGKVVTSIGQMLPSIATGNAAVGTTLLGTQSYGGGIEEAYSNGANSIQAKLYGVANAATEIATEWITGGIPGLKGVGGLDKYVAKGLGQKTIDEVSDSLTKEIIKYGYKIIGEAGEEALAEVVNPILKNATYSEGEEINWNSVIESAIIGGITGGILDAPSSINSMRMSTNSQNNTINNKNNDILSNVDLKSTFQKVNLPSVNNIETNLPPIANQENITYNTNEGDIIDKRTGISNFKENERNVGRGVGTISTNEGVSNILQANNERNNKNQERASIEQDYGTVEERRKYFERVKNNMPKVLTLEQVELQNEIKNLGVDLKYFVGENNGSTIGTTDNGIIYLDVNNENLLNEDSNLKQRFYHELFHNIKRNKDLNFTSEINELKQFVVDNDIESINKYIENRGYDSSLFSNSQLMKLRFAEEVLADYSAKYLSNYNIDYNLSQEAEYRLNTLLDNAISIMKLNTTRIQELGENSEIRTNLNDIKVPIVGKNKVNLPNENFYRNKLKELQSIDTKYMTKKDKSIINAEINNIKNKLNIPVDATKESSYETVNIPTRKEVQNKYMSDTEISKIDFDNARQMNKLMMNRNTAIRLNEKIFGKRVGNEINEKFFYPIKHNESDRIRFLNQERAEIKKLGIEPRTIESAAVQKWGEKKYVNEKGDVLPYNEFRLMDDVPDATMREKVKRAAEIIRNKYDNYLEIINKKLIENGYDPIPARDDYFMHFEELTDIFSMIGIPTKVNDLPTDINGVTDEFRPGKQFFANGLHREGIKTTYDAITGIDRYLESASNQIYHTDDIQRLRALEKYIRDTYGKQKGLSEFEDLTKEELENVKEDYKNRIEKINSGHLSEYASWLQEYTNVLAGKKAKIDRSVEDVFGRKIYKYLQFGKKQVGSNMTGFNIGSALTNFISGTQGLAKTNKIAFMKGTIDTVRNIFKKDGFIDKSDFLTTRFGSDKLSKTTWEKISNAGQLFMSATDYFTANQIVRSKYHEYKNKGYSDGDSIKLADRFADKLMAGRGKGDMPNIFNSQMLGLVTQFQLEVNNQLDSIFYDTLNEDYSKYSNSKLANNSPTKYNAIGAAFVLGQLFTFAYLFNNEYEKIVGRRPAFDVIDMLLNAFDIEEDEEVNINDILGKLFDSLVDNLPFISTFTGGGRIPLSSAIPNVEDVIKGDAKLLDELKKPLFYFLPPTGGGQVKKTLEGLSMFSKDKDIKGSYTSSGNLRFPVEDNLKNKVQAALFGQYANENAREYFDNGYSPLKENQQKIWKETNIPISDYWKNKKEYNYAYNHPERYAAITTITDYNSYTKYNKEITHIKEIYKDADLRKKKVMEYIDSLELTNIQKAIFKKLNYNSYSNYDSEIMKYIEKMDFTAKERKNAYKALGMYKEK